MSVSACIAYIGLRYDVEPGEIDDLEAKTDPRQVAAKSAGLNSYWGNFGGASDLYVLFAGRQIAVIGSEGLSAVQMPAERLSEAFSDTTERLHAAGLPGTATLHLEWLEDS